jgi:hypothetical protein
MPATTFAFYSLVNFATEGMDCQEGGNKRNKSSKNANAAKTAPKACGRVTRPLVAV